MVRASTSGMIDFRQFDPCDTWSWKRLHWILAELETQQTIDVCRVEHNHWITLASHSRLTPESFDTLKTNACAAFNKLLKATYPWQADKIGEVGTQTERDEAVKTYQEIYGKPGEARYEAMVDTLLAELKKPPLTHWEKQRDRARRRKLREAAQQANGG